MPVSTAAMSSTGRPAICVTLPRTYSWKRELRKYIIVALTNQKAKDGKKLAIRNRLEIRLWRLVKES